MLKIGSYLIFLFGFIASVQAASITHLSINGAIGPATADYITRGIDDNQDANLILIELDTPGGLVKSTRQVVKAILNSKVPVVSFVAPQGGRAASAGTFIVYASTVAAMAPGTHLGAASPVNLTGVMGAADKGDKKSTLATKSMNDMRAYIRTLAQIRGRSANFAEKAVVDAATMTANEALKENVINVIAKNKEDLLFKLNGMQVKQNKNEITLKTLGCKINTIKPDLRTKILLVITDPTIAYLLLLLGIYGIFFELMNPGFVAPGVIGAISLLVSLYALQLLPVNYAGLALIALGLSFVIAETFAPSFGILGIGGTIAFVFGSVFLLDTKFVAFQIAWSAILAMAAVNILLFSILLTMLVCARRKPKVHGLESLLGVEGRAVSLIENEGQAVIRGEIWNVYSQKKLKVNTPIRVIAANGLKLEVEAIPE